MKSSPKSPPKPLPPYRSAIGSVGRSAQVAKVVVVLAAFTALFISVSGQLPRLWAQSQKDTVRPSEIKARVLTYVPAQPAQQGQEAQEAHVVFFAPRPAGWVQTFRLQTPRGEVRVQCQKARHFSLPKVPARLSYQKGPKWTHRQYVYHFKSPLLPIYLVAPYKGYVGDGLDEARVNGTTAWGGNWYGQYDHDAPDQRVRPLVLRGTRNTLSLIVWDSGGVVKDSYLDNLPQHPSILKPVGVEQ